MNYFTDVLKKYAVFTGRARRKEYWMYILFYIIIMFVLGFIEGMIGTGGIIGALFGLALLLPSIGVGIRRLHDTGKSGWLLLLGLIPLVGAIILIVFFVQEGTKGDNAYGPDPKALS